MQIIKLIAKAVLRFRAYHIPYSITVIQFLVGNWYLIHEGSVTTYSLSIAHASLWFALGNYMKLGELK